MILVGCIKAEVLYQGASEAWGFVTGVFDALTGGLFSSWSNNKSRADAREDWVYQQRYLDWQARKMLQYQNNENLKYNKQLIDYQNDATQALTETMYNKYQSPEARMNAFKSAGINPNLVAGSLAGTNIGATASSSSSGGSSGNIPTASGLNFQKKYADPTLLMQLSYQREAIKMAKLKNDEQALLNDKLRKEQPFWEQNAENQAKTIMYGVSISDNTAKEIAQKIENLQKEYELIDREITNAHILGNKMAQEANNLVTQDVFLKASIAEKWAMLRKIDNDISVGRATIVMLMSQSGFYESMSKLNDAQRTMVLEQIAGVKTENEMKELQRKMLSWRQKTQFQSAAWGVIQDVVGMITAFMPFVAGYRSSSTTTVIDGNNYPRAGVVGFQ